MIANNITTNSTTTSVQTQEARQEQHTPSELPLWVRIIQAIGPCLVGIGQGLCWIFGSFLILAIVWFVINGTISPDALLDKAAQLLGK